jgi:hypothetical protein
LLQIFFQVVKSEHVSNWERAGRSVGEIERVPRWAGDLGCLTLAPLTFGLYTSQT